MAGSRLECSRSGHRIPQDPADWRTTSALLNGNNERLLRALVQIRDYCKKGELNFTGDYCEEVLFRVTLYPNAIKVEPEWVNPYQPDDFAQEMTILSGRFNDEVKNETFLTVEPKSIPYFRKPELFGELVAEKFTSTSIDIEEAGNCFALNRYTACVFHLMRVLQKGLQVMAKALDVGYQIENWGKMIQEIEAKIKAFDALAKSPEKTEMKRFYSDAAMEFRYFKDAWRNHVVHENILFDEDRTRTILEHVRSFMQSLATKLSE